MAAKYLHLTQAEFEPLLPEGFERDWCGNEQAYIWHVGAHFTVRLLSTVDRATLAFRRSASDAIRCHTLDARQRYNKPLRLRTEGTAYIARSGTPATLKKRIHAAIQGEIAEVRAIPDCPQCGKLMVRRRAHTNVIAGQKPFYGCSYYPDCKGTRSYSPPSAEPQSPVAKSSFEKVTIEDQPFPELA